MVLLAGRAVEDAAPRTLLQRHPFIRFDRTQHTGQLVERALKRLRVAPGEMLELNSIESIADLVRSGLGIALLPELREGRWRSDARLRVIDIPKAEVRQISLVQRPDSPYATVATAVVREFQASLNTSP